MTHLTTRHPLAALALLLALPAAAQTQLATTSPPQNVVSLTATASMDVPKDQLSIVFSTSREGPDAAQVQAQLKQALDTALAEARKTARPGQLDVQTGNFSLYPRHTPKGPSGWTGTAELVVEGKDMAAVSQLAGRIQTMTIARTGFGLSREARNKVDAEVTAQAIADFKARATEIARQFGFGGWALREVMVQGVDQLPVMPMMRAQIAAAPPMGDAPLPIEAGKATVTATVSGSVQLSPR